jgi:hypothetical protein
MMTMMVVRSPVARQHGSGRTRTHREQGTSATPCACKPAAATKHNERTRTQEKHCQSTGTTPHTPGQRTRGELLRRPGSAPAMRQPRRPARSQQHQRQV